MNFIALLIDGISGTANRTSTASERLTPPSESAYGPTPARGRSGLGSSLTRGRPSRLR